jgi:RimJ/RimL family protein N-acetyltransferase
MAPSGFQNKPATPTVNGAPPDVTLRDVVDDDIPVFFEQQLDPLANRMAAFTREDPTDRDAFMAHWRRILAEESVTVKTILHQALVAGHAASFERFGEPEVTYWLGKDHWGRGVATRALSLFLSECDVRPLYARAAGDNLASIRVLEKCGFERVGRDRGHANARGREIDEAILRLDSDPRPARGD